MRIEKWRTLNGMSREETITSDLQNLKENKLQQFICKCV
jgi:hypothetical protein